MTKNQSSNIQTKNQAEKVVLEIVRNQKPGIKGKNKKSPFFDYAPMCLQNPFARANNNMPYHEAIFILNKTWTEQVVRKRNA